MKKLGVGVVFVLSMGLTKAQDVETARFERQNLKPIEKESSFYHLSEPRFSQD